RGYRSLPRGWRHGRVAAALGATLAPRIQSQLVQVADVVGRAGEAAQLPDARSRFVARSDDPIEVRHGRMIRLELAEGELGTGAEQHDVGAQFTGDVARRCDHSL